MKIRMTKFYTSLFKCVALSVASLCFSFSAGAQEKRTLIFSTAEKAAIQEVSERVVREAYRRLGYDVVVQTYPNARSLLVSNAGKVDGELSRIQGIEKRFPNLIALATAVNEVNVVVLGKAGTEPVDSSLSIGVQELSCVRGNKVVEFLAKQEGLNCIYVNDVEQALKLVELERVPFALLPQVNAQSALARLGLDHVVELSPVLLSRKLYHYVHAKNAQLVEALNLELSDMKAQGMIRELRTKYLEGLRRQ